jgi:hypothetical protein
VTEPTGLKITEIRNARKGATNANEEWILIQNNGTRSWSVQGWEITDETITQQRVQIFRFPQRLANGAEWQFDPGQSIYVFTGAGVDQFLASPGAGHRPQFHLHMNRQAMVWNNSGDRVYLRNADGTFVTQPFPVP